LDSDLVFIMLKGFIDELNFLFLFLEAENNNKKLFTYQCRLPL